MLQFMWMGPTGDRRLHAVLTIAWLLFLPLACFTPLRDSLPLVVGISVYANVAGHWAAWQATKADIRLCEDGVPGILRFQLYMHGVLTAAWLIFLPIAVLSPLANSVPLLVAISVYANVAGHWAAWQAARADERQHEC